MLVGVAEEDESHWKGDRERSAQRDRVLFSCVGLWKEFLGVRITRSPYLSLKWNKYQQQQL